MTKLLDVLEWLLIAAALVLAVRMWLAMRELARMEDPGAELGGGWGNGIR